MRLLAFNDPHYTNVPPICRSHDYPNHILDKLIEISDIAKEHKVDFILCTGDWFHRKGKVTHRETIELISAIKRMPCPIWTIFGNHDISGYNLSSVNNRPSGVLVHSGIVKWIDVHKNLTLTDKITGTKVKISGNSYTNNSDSSDENRLKYYGVDRNEDAIYIHLVHSSLIMSGEFFGEYTTFDHLAPLLLKNNRNPDLIIGGHTHFRQSPPTICGITAACIGSIGRVSVDDLNRQPNCLLIKTEESNEKFSIEEIPISCAKMDLKTEKVVKKEQQSIQSVKDFVKLLQIEAEEYESYDYKTLVKKIVRQKGYDSKIADKTLKVLSEHGA